MAKLVDALPSGGSVRKDVQVRILFWAQTHFLSGFFYALKCSTDKALGDLAFFSFLSIYP